MNRLLLNQRGGVIGFMMAATLLLTSCAGGDGVTTQNAADFSKTITGNVTVLDVRTPSEFASGHIQNAVNIDFEAPTFATEIAKLDTSKTYAVYCRSGRRSGLATADMLKAGFKKLFNLDGGIIAWQNAGGALVTT